MALLSNIIKLSLISITLVLMGCGGGFESAGSNGGNNGGGLDIPITDPTDPGTPSYSNGAGVYLRNMHADVTSAYSKVYFHANLGDVVGTAGTASMRQGGSIELTFERSNGTKITRYFSTAGSTYTTLENNFWTTKSSGDPMWRGIFQGEYGALIVVVDGVHFNGDGVGPDDTMAGSVWFRKWQVLENQVLPTHGCTLNSQGLWDCKNQSAPLRQCWYISRGPYDCRFQISANGKLVTRMANATNDTEWVKLGEFTDLNKSKTFHETY